MRIFYFLQIFCLGWTELKIWISVFLGCNIFDNYKFMISMIKAWGYHRHVLLCFGRINEVILFFVEWGVTVIIKQTGINFLKSFWKKLYPKGCFLCESGDSGPFYYIIFWKWQWFFSNQIWNERIFQINFCHRLEDHIRQSGHRNMKICLMEMGSSIGKKCIQFALWTSRKFWAQWKI